MTACDAKPQTDRADAGHDKSFAPGETWNVDRSEALSIIRQQNNAAGSSNADAILGTKIGGDAGSKLADRTESPQNRDSSEDVRKKQEELTSRFGVTFAGAGEHRESKLGFEGTARTPSMDELKHLEETLNINKQMNLNGVKFWYINGPPAEKQGSGQYTRVDGGKDVTLFPRFANQEPDKPRPIEGPGGQKQILAHELTHHEQQEQWGFDDKGFSGDTPEKRELMHKMGWDYDEKYGPVMRDKDGNHWYSKDDDLWARVGDDEKNQTTRTNDELQAAAAVKPPTDYFYYFDEVHAEAASLFRTNREQLAHDTPDMYKVIKEYDQGLIDKRFGTTNGGPQYVRDLDGQIVPNTESTRDKIRAAEQGWNLENR